MRLRIFIAAVIIVLNFSAYSYTLSKEDDEFYKAVKVYSSGLYKKSEELFSEFIKFYPSSSKLSRARFYLAKSLYFEGRYSEAVMLIKVITMDKKAVDLYDEAYYWLAMAYYSSGSYNKALKSAFKVVNSYPDSYFLWQSHYLISQVYASQNKFELAEKELNKIIVESSDKDIANNAYTELMKICYKKGDYDNLGVIASKYLKINSKSRVSGKVYFYKAESCYYKGNYNEAIEWYNYALNMPGGQELKDLIYQGRGLSFIAEGDLNKAKADFLKIRSEEHKLFSEGIYYFNDKEYPLSIDKLNKFINEFTRSSLLPLACLYKAEALYRDGRIKDALYNYKKIIEKSDDVSYRRIIDDAYYGLGWCYIKNGEFRRAIEAFENTIKNTDNIVTKVISAVQIADSYKETNNVDEALLKYNSILRKYPGNMYTDYICFQIGMIMVDKKEWGKALLNFTNLTRKFHSSRFYPEAQYYAGLCYARNGEAEKARLELSRFIKEHPHHKLIWRVYYLYSKCLTEQGGYKNALLYLNKVVNGAKDRELKELSCIDRIQLYRRLREFDNAEKEARKFIRLFAKSKNIALVYLYMGEIYQAESDYSKAEYFYQAAVDERRSFADTADEAEFSLGVLYFNKGYFSKAQRCFKALENASGPLSINAQLYTARIFVNEGKEDKALNIYKDISQGKGEAASRALMEYAFLLKDMGRYNEAKTAFEELIKRGSDFPQVHLAFGFCMEKLGMLKEAIEEYFRIVSNSSKVEYKVKAYFRIARIYRRQNNLVEAESIYRKIINMNREESKIARRELEELVTAAR